MTQYNNKELASFVKNFKMPTYNEIPSVGLYLEQVSKYITECLAPISDTGLTGSMISNYVKKKLVSNPVKKQYSREQIAYLLFIAVAKSALSMDEIKLVLEMQQMRCDAETAYNYFSNQLENMLGYVFGLQEAPKAIDNADNEKTLLQSVLLVFCQKAYLEKALNAIKHPDITE